MEKLWRSIVPGLVVLTCMIAGCAPNPADNSDEQDQGVTVLQETESDLVIKNSDGDTNITVSVHRNGLREPEAIRDPEIDGPFDSDLLVRNRYGFPFISSGNRGGVDVKPDRTFDHEEQLADLHLALSAVQELRDRPGIGESYRWELRSLYYLISWTLNSANDMIDGKIVSEPTPPVIPPELIDQSISVVPPEQVVRPEVSGSPPDGSIGVIRQAYTAPYTHRATIRRYPSFWVWGDHSAVLLEVFDSTGTFVGSISSRNHGREATDPSMSTASGCPKSWGGRANSTPPFQPYVATDTALDGDAGGCNTSYNISGASNTHVCNDDSLAEYQNIKYNSASSWATCGDAVLNQFSPTCN